MAKLFGFWKDGWSIDETKTSVLIMLTIIIVLFGLVMYTLRGDINPSIVEWGKFFGGTIGLVNGVNMVTNAFGNKKEY